MGIRRRTVEHVFGTLKSWMGSTHFLTKTLKNVRTEMSLCVLAYNMKRMIQIMGVSRSSQRSGPDQGPRLQRNHAQPAVAPKSTTCALARFTQPRPTIAVPIRCREGRLTPTLAIPRALPLITGRLSGLPRIGCCGAKVRGADASGLRQNGLHSPDN
jgi:hypothetical protein